MVEHGVAQLERDGLAMVEHGVAELERDGLTMVERSSSTRKGWVSYGRAE